MNASLLIAEARARRAERQAQDWARRLGQPWVSFRDLCRFWVWYAKPANRAAYGRIGQGIAGPAPGTDATLGL